MGNEGLTQTRDTRFVLPCDCGYATLRISNLTRHIKTMHGNCPNQNFTCCGSSFSTKGEYKMHRSGVHSKGYACSDCPKIFSRKALLHRHSSVHTGVKEFRCLLCSYESSHKSNLERHVNAKHRHKHKHSHYFNFQTPDSTSTFSNPNRLAKSNGLSHSIASILSRPSKTKPKPNPPENNQVSSTTGFPGSGFDDKEEKEVSKDSRPITRPWL